MGLLVEKTGMTIAGPDNMPGSVYSEGDVLRDDQVNEGLLELVKQNENGAYDGLLSVCDDPEPPEVVEEPEGEGPEDGEPESTPLSDPGSYTVDEVTSAFEDADGEQVEETKRLEAEGKARTDIAEFEKSSE